ncbi:MAG: flagellar motor switch protein FliG [Planctomycetota bacterium]|nr:flagellar motor switch protein FliG [Planctomycetota bacterium]
MSTQISEKISTLDELNKAAILLLSLEKPLAAEILSQLPKDQVEQVTMRIARLSDVTKEQQQHVFDEFNRISATLTPIQRGGLDAARELITQSLGEGNATDIIDSVSQSMSAVPFGFLQRLGADNLLTFISEEHPQTIALILSHIPQNLAAETLGGLAPHKQTEVIRRIATMGQTSPEVIRDVEQSLERRMRSIMSERMENTGGVQMVAQILNVADRVTNKGILDTLQQDDPKLVDEIRRLMFVFEDLLKLDNKAIQSLLKEVQNTQWALALKGSAEDIKEKILGNMSQRAADLLREEMEFLGPVRVSDVESAQQQIVDVVRRLEDSGEITVSNSGEENEFIT